MVEQHVLRRFESVVGHDIVNPEPFFTEPGRYGARQGQILAEDDRLTHGARDAQDVVVPLPFLGDLDVLCGGVADAAVEAGTQERAGIVRSAHVHQAAGRDQPAEITAQPPEPFGLVILRGHIAGGGAPSHGFAVEGRGGDVEAPVQEHGELESRSGMNDRRAGRPFIAVIQLHGPDARNLVHVAHARAQFFCAVFLSVDFHGDSLRMEWLLY